MKKTFIFILLISVQSFSSTHEESFCSSEKVTFQGVSKLLSKIIRENKEFRILEETQIKIETFKSEESYLKTFFSICSRLDKNKEPLYKVLINDKINNCPSSKEALESILVHELFHIKDYVERTNVDLIKLGITYLTHGDEYERATDVRTVELGYGEGLIQYRYWIYSLLSGDETALEKKIRYYLTPEEIEQLMKELSHQELARL